MLKVIATTATGWEAPVAEPDDDKFYEWDEDTTNWKEIE